jgi:hypothetical protein
MRPASRMTDRASTCTRALDLECAGSGSPPRAVDGVGCLPPRLAGKRCVASRACRVEGFLQRAACTRSEETELRVAGSQVAARSRRRPPGWPGGAAREGTVPPAAAVVIPGERCRCPGPPARRPRDERRARRCHAGPAQTTPKPWGWVSCRWGQSPRPCRPASIRGRGQAARSTSSLAWTLGAAAPMPAARAAGSVTTAASGTCPRSIVPRPGDLHARGGGHVPGQLPCVRDRDGRTPGRVWREREHPPVRGWSSVP